MSPNQKSVLCFKVRTQVSFEKLALAIYAHAGCMHGIDTPLTDKNVKILGQNPEKRDLNTSSEPKMVQNKNSMRDNTKPCLHETVFGRFYLKTVSLFITLNHPHGEIMRTSLSMCE